jgi:hypothetical protein
LSETYLFDILDEDDVLVGVLVGLVDDGLGGHGEWRCLTGVEI